MLEKNKIDNANYVGICLISKEFDRSRSAQSSRWQRNLSVVGGIAGSAGKGFSVCLSQGGCFQTIVSRPFVREIWLQQDTIKREKEGEREGMEKEKDT